MIKWEHSLVSQIGVSCVTLGKCLEHSNCISLPIQSYGKTQFIVLLWGLMYAEEPIVSLRMKYTFNKHPLNLFFLNRDYPNFLQIANFISSMVPILLPALGYFHLYFIFSTHFAKPTVIIYLQLLNWSWMD